MFAAIPNLSFSWVNTVFAFQADKAICESQSRFEAFVEMYCTTYAN